MAKPTEEQVAFLESHGIDLPAKFYWWHCRASGLITYLEQGNGATDKGDEETLEDRAAVYEAALWEFLHLIAVPRVYRPEPRTGTNGPVEVLAICPKSPRNVALQKARIGNRGIPVSPFIFNVVPAGEQAYEGNVQAVDMENYRIGYQGGHEPVNFYRMLEIASGL